MARTSTFDYVVVGAGTAGSVLAGRLAREGPTLLLEAGGPDHGVQKGQDVGALIGKPENLMLSWSSPVTRLYQSEPQPGLGGRSIAIRRGVVRGGSYAINGMIYVRGNRRDYDTWAQLGNDGWSFSEVLPYFMASERFDARPLDYDGGDLAYHGTGGPLDVRPLPNPTPAAGAFIDAARERGYGDSRPSWDFNGHRQENAAGLYQATVTPDGRRATTAFAYLDAAPEQLTVMTGASVARILVDKGRAVGVACMRGGQAQVFRAAREVILAAGAFGSPKLLMLSGIGPADHLRQVGVRTVADLPGVGANLHDHLMILLYHPARRDPGQSSFTAEAGLFVNTLDRSEASAPDLQFHALGRMPALPPARAQVLKLPDDYFLICPTLCKPHSRGFLRLRSRNPNADPIVQPNFLECEADLRVLIRGIDLARELAGTAALGAFHDGAAGVFGVDGRTSEHRPVPGGGQALREFVEATATTVWHPAGSCRMGRDRLAVVDPELRVHGIEGLRIADASIIPTIVSGNINAACVMIGEKCADMVAGRRREPIRLPEGSGRPADGDRTPPDGRAAGLDYAEMAERLGQMALAVAGSGARSWGRAAEMWGRALPAFVQTLAEVGAPGQRRPDAAGALLDQARAYLRDLAEFPGREARQLEAELGQVARTLAPDTSTEPEAGSGPYWRRWQAKP